MTDPHELLGLDPADPEAAAAMHDTDTLMDLILALTASRTALGMSQAEVAQRMGVTEAEVTDFERVGGDPRFTTVQRYARAVGYQLTASITTETQPHNK
ncbi:helix-turn-helix transcriptional regulator [Streptomyces bauhiniae]|uniref:helix-turn-helix domain-containing protein n=1 Tax=Streptomyces bauhiniae TaxID=2340725 RepID=UPI0033AA8D59